MSGHSKWSKVKHIKAVEDVKKAKIYAKHLRAITVAARQGGGDPAGNAALRNAVIAANADNVPKDNIERAIKRGTGDVAGVEIEEATYEGYAGGGVAVLVEVLTDKKSRTLPELRHLFDRHGASLGQDGCVAWMFERKGYVVVEKEGADEDTVMEAAIEAGAEDIKDGSDAWEITTPPEAFEAVVDAVKAAEIQPAMAEIQMAPKTTVRVEGEEAARKILKFLDALEDHDDVQSVWANYDIDDEIVEAVQSGG
jgi:YebC/PmpR family DNA-binding regulatory protein